MNNRLTAAERQHLGRIKAMPCGVCGASGQSEAHHVNQHQQYTAIPLCADCHRGSHNGIHGNRRIWAVKKLDEMTVLNNTIKEMLK